MSPIPKKRGEQGRAPSERNGAAAGQSFRKWRAHKFIAWKKGMGQSDSVDQHLQSSLFATDTVKFVQFMWNQ